MATLMNAPETKVLIRARDKHVRHWTPRDGLDLGTRMVEPDDALERLAIPHDRVLVCCTRREILGIE